MIRRLVGHGAVYLVSNVAMRAMTVVLAPLYTRRLSAEGYGELAWATTVGAAVTLGASLALPAGLARFLPAAKEEELAALNGSAIAASLATALVCVLAAFMFENQYMKYVLLASAFTFGQGLAVQAFAAQERSAMASLVNLVAVASNIGFALWLVVVEDRGVRGALLASVLSAACTCLLSLVLLVRALGFTPRWASTALLLRFSLPLVPHLAANWVLAISDRVLIERYVGKAALAPYVVAYFFHLACVMLTSALAQALAPIFVREAERGRDRLPLLGDVCVASSVLFGLMSCLLAPWVLPLVAPDPAYAAGLRYVPWLVLGAVFQGLYFVLSQGSWYSARTALVPAVTALAAAVNLTMNVVLLPRFGAIAAAWATALAYAVLCVAHGVLANRLFCVRWHYRRWATMLGAAALVYLGAVCAS